MRNPARSRTVVLVTAALLLLVAYSASLYLFASWTLRPQQAACQPLDTGQVHLTGTIPGKGGTWAITTDGLCAQEYFILAQKSGSHFRLDPNVVKGSLGVAVTYFVRTLDKSVLVAVFVPATGDIYLDASDEDGLAVTPQSIVVFTSNGSAGLNGGLAQAMMRVDAVAATCRVDSIPVYASTHEAILGAVGS